MTYNFPRASPKSCTNVKFAISLAHTHDIGLVDLVLSFLFYFFGGVGGGRAPGRLELMKVHMS